MEYKKPMSIVLDLNSIDEGLNFIVPSDWWTGFLALNQNKERFQELEIPEAHPLSFLFEIGIVQNCSSDLRGWMRGHSTKLRTLQEHAQSSAVRVNSHVKQVSNEGLYEGSKKRNRPLFEWWDFDSIEQSRSYNKILLSPSIDFSVLADIGGFQWKVVSSRLYKLISQGDFFGKDEKYRQFMIGIPVFLKQNEVRAGQNEMDYSLGNQVKISTYFYNTLGLKYAFLGAVQKKMNLDRVLRYLFYGLNKMAVHGFITPSKNFRNQLRIHNHQIYYNFDDEEQNCAKLNWWPFSKFFNQLPIDGMQVIELSSYCKRQIQQEGVIDLKPTKGIKKLKKDQAQPNIIDRTAKKKRGNIPQSKERFSARYERFKKFKRSHPDWFKNQPRNSTQHHYSTEQETPSVITDEGIQMQLIMQSREENRIHYPIWRNFHSVQSLNRLAQIKINQSLPLPFTIQNKKIVRTKEGKRVLITSTSNKLVQQNGELVEVQQQKYLQKGVPEDIIKQLENLALEITGQKRKMNIELLIKQEQLQAAKEKIDIQSRTCKNEEEQMDDFDEAESREC